MTKSPDLSVIILNYNSGDYLNKCLQSIKVSDLKNYKIEVIVVDNSSTDKSFTVAQKIKFPNLKFVKSPGNIGFSAGNNYGLKFINNPRYVLFLNPDTVVNPDTLSGMINYLDNNPYIDAATCDVILAKTNLTQLESHRDFPTPLNAFLHFSGISSNLYFMKHLDYSKTVQINACVGAFIMLKKSVGDTIGWWNEKYFMYGEDLDFCFKLKTFNFKLFFVPNFKIIHYQGMSSGLVKTKTLTNASRSTKIRSAKATTNAMRIFYQENLFPKYSFLTRLIVLTGIKTLEFYRVFKAKYL